MKPSLIRSFIFNRTVIALLIAACFVVTALDLYLDFARKEIVDFSALKITESNTQLLSQSKSDVLYKELEEFAGTLTTKILWVLVILTLLSTLSLVIFFGTIRWKGEVLAETQQKALYYQKALTDAYGRFFPHQFLDLLDKKSILDVRLGDHAEKQMVVVFADIRNFTSLIEKLTSEEGFKMINDYLLQVSPIIRMNNGFIDKYIGDAIMALFEKTDDAITAFTQIMHVLQQNPSSEIRSIGVGMHVGSLMVGTVGEFERMDGTVISDIVNTASRLEALNKAYGTRLLISEEILNHLSEPGKYKIRFIDNIYAKGKYEAIKIFEIFDTESAEIIQKKESIKEIWEKGIDCYRNKKFSEALGFFQQCQSIYPEDRATFIYIQRTQDLIANPPDETWKPIARLSEKGEVH